MGQFVWTIDSMTRLVETAARNGNNHVIEHLRQLGAGIGGSMYLASGNGHLSTVTMLVDTGVVASSLGREGWTPLMHAVFNGHLHVVEYLVRIDCGLNAISAGIKRRTALHWACFRDFPEIARVLLAAGANKTIVDANGETPAMVAERTSPVCFSMIVVDYDLLLRVWVARRRIANNNPVVVLGDGVQNAVVEYAVRGINSELFREWIGEYLYFGGW